MGTSTHDSSLRCEKYRSHLMCFYLKFQLSLQISFSFEVCCTITFGQHNIENHRLILAITKATVSWADQVHVLEILTVLFLCASFKCLPLNTVMLSLVNKLSNVGSFGLFLSLSGGKSRTGLYLIGGPQRKNSSGFWCSTKYYFLSIWNNMVSLVKKIKNNKSHLYIFVRSFRSHKVILECLKCNKN